MIKEIGSIFPLASDLIIANRRPASYHSGRLYYSLCREVLCDIARLYENSNKTVLIPAYTCQTVISPFRQFKWNVVFYSLKKDLRIDIDNLKRKAALLKPALIIAHPYFGMDLSHYEDKTLSELTSPYTKIIVDLTQCIFSNHDYGYADYIVGSYRKWFPIPDGGFLVSEDKRIEQPKEENSAFTECQSYAMYLREAYFRCGDQFMKEISIKLNKKADCIAEQYAEPHRMSDLACNLLVKQNVEDNKTRRLENYRYLHSHINDGVEVRKVCGNIERVTTAPLYFTIYVRHRKELQTILAENSVYAPVIWPVEEAQILINDEISYIYQHLLAIPCDQRYDITDMQRIVELINEFNEKN